MTDNVRQPWCWSQSAAALRAMAARLRAMDPVRLEVLSNAATLPSLLPTSALACGLSVVRGG